MTLTTQDVVEARKNNWVRRRIVEGPQSILDLHTKAYLSSDPLMTSSISARPHLVYPSHLILAVESAESSSAESLS